MKDSYSENDNESKKTGGIEDWPSLEDLGNIAKQSKSKESFSHFDNSGVNYKKLAFFAVAACCLIAFCGIAISSLTNYYRCEDRKPKIAQERSCKIDPSNDISNSCTQSNSLEKDVSCSLSAVENSADSNLSSKIVEVRENNNLSASVAANSKNDDNLHEENLPTINDASSSLSFNKDLANVSDLKIATVATEYSDFTSKSTSSFESMKVELDPLDSFSERLNYNSSDNSKYGKNNFLANVLMNNDSAIARDSFDSQVENFIEGQTGEQFSFRQDTMFKNNNSSNLSVQNWLGSQKIQGVAFKGRDSCIVLNSKIFHVGDLINSELYVIWADIDPEARLLYFVDGNGASYAAKY